MFVIFREKLLCFQIFRAQLNFQHLHDFLDYKFFHASFTGKYFYATFLPQIISRAFLNVAKTMPMRFSLLEQLNRKYTNRKFGNAESRSLNPALIELINIHINMNISLRISSLSLFKSIYSFHSINQDSHK